MIPLIFLILIVQTMTDIVDYTREDYVLLEDGDRALYNDYANIFHITNLFYFRELINSEKSYSNKNTDIIIYKGIMKMR